MRLPQSIAHGEIIICLFEVFRRQKFLLANFSLKFYNFVKFSNFTVAARGTFTVDPMSGVVQTAVKHYKPGETYRIFVQARDLTPTDPEVSQVKI